MSDASVRIGWGAWGRADAAAEIEAECEREAAAAEVRAEALTEEEVEDDTDFARLIVSVEPLELFAAGTSTMAFCVGEEASSSFALRFFESAVGDMAATAATKEDEAATCSDEVAAADGVVFGALAAASCCRATSFHAATSRTAIWFAASLTLLRTLFTVMPIFVCWKAINTMRTESQGDERNVAVRCVGKAARGRGVRLGTIPATFRV